MSGAYSGLSDYLLCDNLYLLHSRLAFFLRKKKWLFNPRCSSELDEPASDSEELAGNLNGALPPSGYERCTSTSCNELLDVVTCAVEYKQGVLMGELM